LCAQVDIVTISLGGVNGWADGSWAEVASRLVDEGVVVTAAAGNDGGTGPFFASTGSSGRSVLSIASADTDPELDTIVKPSNFTSWGGLYDLALKPDVAAPGRNILSVSISAPDALVAASGTSMATPYVAGIAALWIGEHGGRSVHGKGLARRLHQRIISSGESLPWIDADGVRSPLDWRAPPAQVGSGLVDAWKVLQYTSHLDFDKIALNDTRNFKSNHPVSVFNGGDEPATYNFEIENSAGLELLGWLDGWRGRTRRVRNTTELQPVELVPRIMLPRSFTLGPGESRTVS
jgi:subtilisin family serine protease